MMVSILVLVDVALEPLALLTYRLVTIVSILVLVDVALEHHSVLGVRLYLLGFNPCSRGCRS